MAIVTKSAAGRSQVIKAPRVNGGILATVSAGAVLVYNIEVTGDDTSVSGYSPAAGNWNVFDNMGALTASANATLIGQVMAFSINITSYTSGSVTLAIIDPWI